QYEYQDSTCSMVFTVDSLAGSSATDVQINIARDGVFSEEPFSRIVNAYPCRAYSMNPTYEF
ncbi:MAG: hypothetical protein VXZ65_05110, partial [Candidatus Thermoplasmatota archaeon]|nr:hypothetical protein [Candidatus Thermoplasmatota archaeon]